VSDVDKVETNRVHGCESQVWLVGESARWALAVSSANSDARLIRGLVALLLARVNGLSAAELQQVDLPDWFNQLGLGRQFSQSRSNGLNAVLKHE
jgi:cysteine desulfuration protein SufE